MESRNTRSAVKEMNENAVDYFKFKYNRNMVFIFAIMGCLMFFHGLDEFKNMRNSGEVTLLSPAGFFTAFGAGIVLATSIIAASVNGMILVRNFLLPLFAKPPVSDKTFKKKITVDRTPKPIPRQEVSSYIKMKRGEGVKKPKKTWKASATELVKKVSFSNMKKVGRNLLWSLMNVVNQGAALAKKLGSIDFKRSIQFKGGASNKGKARAGKFQKLRLQEPTDSKESQQGIVQKNEEDKKRDNTTLSIVVSLSPSSPEGSLLPQVPDLKAVAAASTTRTEDEQTIESLADEVQRLKNKLSSLKKHSTGSKQAYFEKVELLQTTLAESKERLTQSHQVYLEEKRLLQSQVGSLQEKLGASQAKFDEVKNELTQAIAEMGLVKGENSQKSERLSSLESLLRLLNDSEEVIDPTKYVPLFETILTASRAIRTADAIWPSTGNNQHLGAYTYNRHLEEVSQQLTDAIKEAVNPESFILPRSLGLS